MNSGSKTPRLNGEHGGETRPRSPHSLIKSLDVNATSGIHVDAGSSGGSGPPTALVAWLSPQPVRRLAPGQDYVDGVLYYHLDGGEAPVLLTSRRDLLPGARLPEKLRPPSTPPRWPRISGEAVKRFLEGAEAPRADELHARVRELLARFVPFDDEAADLIALWLMHTYLFRVFGRTPYLHLRCEPGAGASITADLTARLAWNGELRHGLDLDSVASGAGETTTVFGLGASEAAVHDGVARILATGASAPGLIPCPGDHEVLWRTVHSPRAFVTTSDLALPSGSSVRVDLLPAHPDEEREAYHAARVAGEVAALLDDLHVFALARAADVAAIADNDLIPGTEDLDAENRDLWLPPMAIAVFIDQAGGNGDLARRMARLATQLSLGRTTLSRRLVRLLGEIIDTGDPAPLQGNWYEARQVMRTLTATLEVPELADLPTFLAALARLGIASDRRYFPDAARYERCIELDPEHLGDLRERFGIRFVPGALAGADGRRPDRQEVA